MRVASFLKANNVVFHVFVVFPSFLLMQQQFQLFRMLPIYMVKISIMLSVKLHKQHRVSLHNQYLGLQFFQQTFSYKLHMPTHIIGLFYRKRALRVNFMNIQ